MSTPDPDRTPSDEKLLHLVGTALDEDEPPPPWATDFAIEAYEWRDMDGQLAELLHDSVVDDVVVLRADGSPRLLVFHGGELTLDIEHGPDQLAGSVSPGGRYRVGIQEGAPAQGHPAAPELLTDDTGMFARPGAVRGPVRFVVSSAGGGVAIVSPWVSL